VQRQVVLQRHISVTRKNRTQLSHADLIVWPESAAGNDPVNDLTTRYQIQQVVDEVDKPFLIGGTTWQGNPSAPRNVGLLWLPKTGPQHQYIKNHLVPFGEYIPLRSFLASHIKRFSKVPVDFVAGKGGGIFRFKDVNFGDAICFEVAYDDHISALVNGGAQFIAAQSNNSTYLGTGQPAQQFQITRFRAIEHQRAIVVATTTGISGIISSDGKVLKMIQHNSGEVLKSTIPIVSGRQVADQFPHIFEVCSVAILLCLIIIRLRRARFPSKDYI
jgi:apolipoprotein N-acyltransferase